MQKNNIFSLQFGEIHLFRYGWKDRLNLAQNVFIKQWVFSKLACFYRANFFSQSDFAQFYG